MTTHWNTPIDSNPYQPPHARDLDPERSSPPTSLAVRWLGVHCAVAAVDAAILLVLRTRRHQLDAPFLSLASLLAYVVPRFLRMATYGGLAVSFLKGRSPFGTAAFVLELLSLAVSADAIVAMLIGGSDLLRILPALSAPLGVAVGLLAFGAPSRAPVWAGIGMVCLSAALKATPLLALL